MQKRLLITGGAGFIGSALAKFLVDAGHSVAVLDNLSFGSKAFVPAQATFYEGDLRDLDRLKRIVAEIHPEIVYHLAAIHFIPYCNDHPLEAVDVNIRGTRNFLTALSEHKPKSLFFASTAAIYPCSDHAHKETDTPSPFDIYGITKLIGEDLVKLFHLETGVRCIIGRLFNAYGPNETNPHVIPEIIEQLKRGKRSLELGNIDPKRDFIHTHDLSRAAISAIEKWDQRMGVFNIGTQTEYSVRETVEICAKILGEPISIIQKPERIRKVERNHLLADTQKIRSATGWKPQISFEEGLKDLLVS